MTPPTFPVHLDAWPLFAEGFAKPWPREAAIADLQWWTVKGKIPAQPELRERWGWSDRKVRQLVASGEWVNRTIDAPTMNTGLHERNSGIREKRTRPKRGKSHSADRPRWLHLGSIIPGVKGGRWKDLRRIAYSLPEFRRLVSRGWDHEDVYQELALRVIERQEIHAAYDPARAGLPKYLHTLCEGILRNLLEGTRALKVVTQDIGVPQLEDGVRVMKDAAEVAIADPPAPDREADEPRRLVDELLARGWVEFEDGAAAGRFVEAVRGLRGGKARAPALAKLLATHEAVAEYWATVEDVTGLLEVWG